MWVVVATNSLLQSSAVGPFSTEKAAEMFAKRHNARYTKGCNWLALEVKSRWVVENQAREKSIA